MSTSIIKVEEILTAELGFYDLLGRVKFPAAINGLVLVLRLPSLTLGFAGQ